MSKCVDACMSPWHFVALFLTARKADHTDTVTPLRKAYRVRAKQGKPFREVELDGAINLVAVTGSIRGAYWKVVTYTP